MLYLVYPLIPAIWWLLYRTRWGLTVRAIGEDPNSADVSGIDVNRLRRQTIYLAGITAGIGGGYFLFARSGRFEDSLIGGRGYIAIAAVIFGGWTAEGHRRRLRAVRPRRLVRPDDPVARVRGRRPRVPGHRTSRRDDPGDGASSPSGCASRARWPGRSCGA